MCFLKLLWNYCKTSQKILITWMLEGFIQLNIDYYKTIYCDMFSDLEIWLFFLGYLFDIFEIYLIKNVILCFYSLINYNFCLVYGTEY